MGGHGALTLFLKNPGKYRSVSAFAPIANPMKCPWGEKAFRGYLGEDRGAWKEYDACELVGRWEGGELDVLIDVVCSLRFSLWFRAGLCGLAACWLSCSVFFLSSRGAGEGVLLTTRLRDRVQRTIFTNRASSCRRTL